MATLTVFEASPMNLQFEMQIIGLDVDLGRLKAGGADLARFNLKEHAEAFGRYPEVLSQMGKDAEFLPIFLLDGEIVSKAIYPTREQLANWAGIRIESSGCGGGGRCTCGG